MPELPEVETVRAGLDKHVVGRRIRTVEVLHPRAVRRHLGDAPDLIGRLRGAAITAARRRGKYLWLNVIAPGGRDHVALVVHLGMSGQMLVAKAGAPDHTHLRIRARLDDGNELRFVDQRTFGGWHLDEYVDEREVDGSVVLPASIAHIAPDPFDPAFDQASVITRIRAKHTEIKRALLDQTLISGVGNIYADEALWRARLHGARLTDSISRAKIGELLDAATAVMSDALAVGGTSFDALYVNVNGQSGYFERSLNAYGREGQPCRRCGQVMRRAEFMNRSSFFCPKCQRAPRVTRSPR
ncbi:MAG: bifunctional DNA-formamidopyrimidine glycosylase/DNA-(apurinic or apyrimidinic site) lyase [Gordonia sp. (in: high G+C Gram-positive bacteria)]